MSYYIKKMFLNIYNIQLDRTPANDFRNVIKEITGANIPNSYRMVIMELLSENEKKHKNVTYSKDNSNIERND